MVSSRVQALPENLEPQLFGGAAVFAVAPNVEVALRVVAGRAALDEPGVHLRGVVHDEVHNHANAPGVRLGEHAVKVLHRAEAGLDGLVVADIVAVVPAGGAIEGREPDDVHAQLAQVVQAAGDAGKVAYAVAVGVLEAAGVDLVDHALPSTMLVSYLVILLK